MYVWVLVLSELTVNSTVKYLRLRLISRKPERKIKTSYLTEFLGLDKAGKTCIISIWGKGEGNRFQASQIIEIKNGWCKEYNGTLQISAGKYGSIISLGEEDDSTIPSTL